MHADGGVAVGPYADSATGNLRHVRAAGTHGDPCFGKGVVADRALRPAIECRSGEHAIARRAAVTADPSAHRALQIADDGYMHLSVLTLRALCLDFDLDFRDERCDSRGGASDRELSYYRQACVREMRVHPVTHSPEGLAAG